MEREATYVHAYHRRFGSHRRLYIADERWTDCMGRTNRRSAGALSDSSMVQKKKIEQFRQGKVIYRSLENTKIMHLSKKI